MVFRNLPEVRSAHEILGVPSVSARFGTAPFFWNWGMEAMTNIFPPVCSKIISAIAKITHEVFAQYNQLHPRCWNILTIKDIFFFVTYIGM